MTDDSVDSHSLTATVYVATAGVASRQQHPHLCQLRKRMSPAEMTTKKNGMDELVRTTVHRATDYRTR